MRICFNGLLERKFFIKFKNFSSRFLDLIVGRRETNCQKLTRLRCLHICVEKRERDNTLFNWAREKGRGLNCDSRLKTKL